MRCQVPQISWHGRDPVLSIDFQPNQTDVLRLASGGTDSHVLIWYVTYQENKSINIECAADLYRHNKSVNVVRFSPNGEFLASGDDEGAMFIWELKGREQIFDPPNEDDTINKECWYPVKLLRGHLDDIYDICWSKEGNFLVSSSMDNTAIIWDMQKYVKTHIFTDFKGYVQGVTWDPLNQFIASLGSDRSLRIHNINSKKSMYKISKAPWTNSTEKGTFKARLFYDDTLQSYFRRLTFTPDGELLIVPSGILEKGEKITNSCFIFSRHALNKPVISLPTGDKYTVAVKCNPFLYKLRGEQDIADKENKTSKPMINLPYRMIFAVAACDSVLIYDTEQLVPFAYVSNIHYTHLTDLSWSSDGLTLVVSSTDGYCSFILFTREELGEIYIPEKTKNVKESEKALEICKNEDINLNQLPSTLSVLNTESKTSDTPNTATISISAKSPKPNSGTKNESITPSTKVKVAGESKAPLKKPPKVCSIKNFFISPKTSPAVSVFSKNTDSVKECSVSKETSISSEHEVNKSITMEVQNANTENSTNLKHDSVSENVKVQQCLEEAMDIDDNGPVKGCKNKLQSSPNSSGHGKRQSKCKVRLNFADKMNFIESIDDNASDSNPLTIEDNAKLLNESQAITENENDWKLELSQDDDDIVPMEVTPTEIKPVTLVNETVKTNEPAVSGSKSENKKETPKRRVAFVTLSSKPTFK